MPRKHVIKSSVFPYHICARSNNQDWFSLPLEETIDIFAQVTSRTQEQYKFRFELFTLMSNHFHMIISTPNENISEGMRYFMTESSRGIARASNRINRIFGQRYHWTIIRDPAHYAVVYKYVARNPVAAYLVHRVEEWPFSSLAASNNKMKNLVAVNPEFLSTLSPLVNSGWLNTPYDLATQELISLALRRSEFISPRERNSREPINFDALLNQKVPGTFIF